MKKPAFHARYTTHVYKQHKKTQNVGHMSDAFRKYKQLVMALEALRLFDNKTMQFKNFWTSPLTQVREQL